MERAMGKRRACVTTLNGCQEIRKLVTRWYNESGFSSVQAAVEFIDEVVEVPSDFGKEGKTVIVNGTLTKAMLPGRGTSKKKADEIESRRLSFETIAILIAAGVFHPYGLDEVLAIACDFSLKEYRTGIPSPKAEIADIRAEIEGMDSSQLAEVLRLCSDRLRASPAPVDPSSPLRAMVLGWLGRSELSKNDLLNYVDDAVSSGRLPGMMAMVLDWLESSSLNLPDPATVAILAKILKQNDPLAGTLDLNTAFRLAGYGNESFVMTATFAALFDGEG